MTTLRSRFKIFMQKYNSILVCLFLIITAVIVYTAAVLSFIASGDNTVQAKPAQPVQVEMINPVVDPMQNINNYQHD